jgi:hypothetical protein
MRFDKGIAPKYRQSIEDAFQTILEKGNANHRRTAQLILDSEMLVCVQPVSRVNGSGITGAIDRGETNDKIQTERLNVREALGEIFITIAEETIDTGFQRGCEGTFVHENQHALDFAETIASFSDADVNPLSLFDPTHYEMELRAHITAGEYMLEINRDEYLEEGFSLMILGRNENGYFIDREGIDRRLRESYGLSANGNQGRPASELLGLRLR